MKQYKTLLFVIVVILVLGIGYAYWKKNGAGSHQTTLVGTMDCLRPKSGAIPENNECRSAIKTDKGAYYALDFTKMRDPYPHLEQGMRFSATGEISPIEELNSGAIEQYNVEGVFWVTGNVKLETSE